MVSLLTPRQRRNKMTEAGTCPGKRTTRTACLILTLGQVICKYPVKTTHNSLASGTQQSHLDGVVSRWSLPLDSCPSCTTPSLLREPNEGGDGSQEGPTGSVGSTLTLNASSTVMPSMRAGEKNRATEWMNWDQVTTIISSCRCDRKQEVRELSN